MNLTHLYNGEMIMAIRELRHFENPDLQRACRPVAEVGDHIRRLLDDLADTMRAVGAVSLSANQVGVFRRVAVLDSGSGLLRLVNPVITERSGEQEIEEDCVSFKDIAGIALRPRRIVLEALDENGAAVTHTFEGEAASRVCHILDHLDGKILVKEIVRFSSRPLEGEE